MLFNKQKYLRIYYIFPLFFLSCATTLNNATQKVNIITDETIKGLNVNKALKNESESKTFYILRDREPLELNVKSDSLNEKTVFIKSRNSFHYIISNLICTYGVGYLIERKNSKRYAYPKHIYLKLKDTSITVRRFPPTKAGSINLNIALPHINFFYLQTKNNNYRNSGGFWGFETGVDYFYKDNQYLSFNVGIASDFFVPVPAVVDIGGEYQLSSTLFGNLRNNYIVGSFDLGYGVNFSKLNWRITNNKDITFVPQSKYSFGMGLSLVSQYRIGKHFRIGVLYQPNFFTLSPKSDFDYQHYISIEGVWKIKIR